MAHGINTTAGTRKESRLKGSCISESASRELTVMSQRALLTTILQVRHCNPQARWLALSPKAASFLSPYDRYESRRRDAKNILFNVFDRRP